MLGRVSPRKTVVIGGPRLTVYMPDRSDIRGSFMIRSARMPGEACGNFGPLSRYLTVERVGRLGQSERTPPVERILRIPLTNEAGRQYRGTAPCGAGDRIERKPDEVGHLIPIEG